MEVKRRAVVGTHSNDRPGSNLFRCDPAESNCRPGIIVSPRVSGVGVPGVITTEDAGPAATVRTDIAPTRNDVFVACAAQASVAHCRKLWSPRAAGTQLRGPIERVRESRRTKRVSPGSIPATARDARTDTRSSSSASASVACRGNGTSVSAKFRQGNTCRSCR